MLTREELINKYIKYDSSITEEMFNAIIKKLEEAYIPNHPDNIRTSFTEFKEEKHIFNLNYNNEGYYIGNVIASVDVEIKVSDILGEETKFEVGKWYSFYWNWSSGYNCIGKVCQVGNSVRTTIHFDNYTSNNSPGKLFTDGRTIYLAEIENIKELSSEEIQQYLPDNHPDKLPKTIEKWSVGSYVVFLQKYGRSNKGTIDVIKEFDYNLSVSFLEKEGLAPGFLDRELNNYLKWFATLSEAEAFSKSLLEPKKEDLNKYDSEGNLIEMKKYVKCDTQEQWDFVLSKFNPSDLYESTFNIYSSIGIDLSNGCYTDSDWYDKNGYKKVTFQEWLNLNGYTFEEGMSNKFNIGDEVMVIADSLKEFNSSWTRGNNTGYKEGHIGIVSNVTNSSKKEINTWCYLEDHSSAISCNLLELVESSESSKSKKIDRNVYYEVETQEQYLEILDWLESKGEFLHPNSRKLTVINNWKYVVFDLSIPNSWALRGGIPNLPKAEFQFKGRSEKQPIKTGGGLRERILQNQYQYECKTIDSSSVWETLMNPHTQNSTINLKQEPIKLLSFEEDDVVLFKTNSVKISNKQLIIND